MKGCICLDIDGTITADPYAIPEPVLDCFRQLHQRGWAFLFVTGRLYSFAIRTLARLDFPYFFALQNGADLFLMPEKKLLAREYLSSSKIPLLEEACKGMKEDFLLYSGPEQGDFCYYRPSHFSPKMLEHLEIVKTVSDKPWQAREDFVFPKETFFPLIKILGSQEEVFSVKKRLHENRDFEVSCVKDPLSKEIHLNLITSPLANKGHVLKKIRSFFVKETMFIAAGDDFNDIPMLEEADVAIVMNTAPEPIWSYADILARPAAECGIIEALLQATGEAL